MRAPVFLFWFGTEGSRSLVSSMSGFVCWQALHSMHVFFAQMPFYSIVRDSIGSTVQFRCGSCCLLDFRPSTDSRTVVDCHKSNCRARPQQPLERIGRYDLQKLEVHHDILSSLVAEFLISSFAPVPLLPYQGLYLDGITTFYSAFYDRLVVMSSEFGKFRAAQRRPSSRGAAARMHLSKRLRSN